MEDIIKKMSIRGRMYFCLQCLQNTFKKNNIKTVESELIIKIIIDFLRKDEFNKWEESANNILPVNILDSKFDVNDFTMDHTLVFKLKSFYEQLPLYIINMIDDTLNVGLNNLYGGTGEYSPLTLKSTVEVISLCRENNIELPDINNFLKFEYNSNHGWGKEINDIIIT